MSTDDEILIDGLRELEPAHAELNECAKTYAEVCERLSAACQRHLRAVERLDEIAAGKSSSNLTAATRCVATTHRENALLQAEAARHLSRMSSKCLALAEKIDSLI